MRDVREGGPNMHILLWTSRRNSTRPQENKKKEGNEETPTPLFILS
jgi:hypothetical protein